MAPPASVSATISSSVSKASSRSFVEEPFDDAAGLELLRSRALSRRQRELKGLFELRAHGEHTRVVRTPAWRARIGLDILEEHQQYRGVQHESIHIFHSTASDRFQLPVTSRRQSWP